MIVTAFDAGLFCAMRQLYIPSGIIQKPAVSSGQKESNRECIANETRRALALLESRVPAPGNGDGRGDWQGSGGCAALQLWLCDEEIL